MKRILPLVAAAALLLTSCTSSQVPPEDETSSSTSASTTTSSTKSSTMSSTPSPSPTTEESTLQNTSVAPIEEPVPPPAPSSAPTQTPTPPVVVSAPTAVLGEYCQSYGGTGTAADGSTLYCATLNLTDAFLWHTSPGIAPNPEVEAQMFEQMALTVQPGQVCYDETFTLTIADGTPLYCNPTVNGRNAGTLVWHLVP